MIADEVNMSRETVLLVLTEELGLRKKSVPRCCCGTVTAQQWDARLGANFDIQMHCGDATASLLN